MLVEEEKEPILRKEVVSGAFPPDRAKKVKYKAKCH